MDKEILIQTIWNDKKGKSDKEAPFALYVALDSPRPNLSSLTDSMFEALQGDISGAREWAKTWGRTVICVGPGCKQECILGLVADDKNKRFVPVRTTQILDAEKLEQLILPVEGGSMATIVLNSQPTTIEAFLISYIHMVDELIWDNFLAQGSYSEAVQSVKDKRFSLTLASEDAILSQRMANPAVSVRLYGSKVNKNVPRVMGGIIPREVIC